MQIRRTLSILLFFLTVNCYGILLAQEKDYPKNGEGITGFLRRHNRTGDAYQKEFIELNKNKLGKNNSLLLHIQYALPPLKNDNGEATTPATANTSPTPTSSAAASGVGKKKREPLFGKELAEYEIISDDLKGACFYVVAGHGGPDPGAIGKMGNHILHEDEYAYDITLRLARSLLTRGATVHIIIQDELDGIRDDRILANSKRETCMGSPISHKQFERLNQRCDKINLLYKKEKPAYARAIFIHIDSRSIHKRVDVFFYHSPSKESKELAHTMRKTFSDKYRRHQPERGFSGTVDERGLYVLNQTLPVALFVELGNIQNSYDQQRFILSNNRQALANWLCDGFVADYKSKK